MRYSNWVGFALLACCTLLWQQTMAKEKPAPTLEQDRQKLEGIWRTESWRRDDAQGWQCQLAVSLTGSQSPRLSLTVNFERGGKPSSGPVLGSQVQLKQKGGQRWLALDPKAAKASRLPEEIFCRFEGDSLVLVLTQTESKGEYRLERVNAK